MNKSISLHFGNHILQLLLRHIQYMYHQHTSKYSMLHLKQILFPSKWKVATIVPVFKSGDAKNVGNYRPIALTPTPCKLIERIAHKHIFNFINHHNILTPHQGGFRPGKSTINTLSSFTDDIAKNSNIAKPTVAAFIDLSKAFDTVDHLILKSKLDLYGIRGGNLDWMVSYLSG